MMVAQGAHYAIRFRKRKKRHIVTRCVRKGDRAVGLEQKHPDKN